jgi:apolipoprotein N-acyltransferase
MSISLLGRKWRRLTAALLAVAALAFGWGLHAHAAGAPQTARSSRSVEIEQASIDWSVSGDLGYSSARSSWS